MVAAGLDPGRVAEVVGRADAEPLVAEQPADPRNRRISVVLLRAADGTTDDRTHASGGPGGG
jgi:chemotaxis protein MotB